MEFASHLTQAVLLKRYKRFLAEVIVNNQESRMIYCPNMGAMTGCDILGSRVWFSHSLNPRRKFPDTWELVEVDAGFLVSINNLMTSQLICEGIQNRTIKELCDYTAMSLEPPLLDEHACDIFLQSLPHSSSNVGSTDFDLRASPIDKCFVNITSVTLGDEIHRGFFPDAVTEKGVHQLKSLIIAREYGYRAVLVYCVQHTGIHRLFPADHIDSKYGSMLRQALIAGVEIIAYRAEITLSEINIASPIEVCIPARMICSSRL